MRVLHGATIEGQLPCSHGTPVLCDVGEEHWPLLSLFLAPTQPGRMKWVNWRFLCWGGGGAHVVGHVTKASLLCYTLHMPEFWLWDEVHGEKKRVHSWASQSMILTCCSFKVWLAVLGGQRRLDLQLLYIWSCASMVLLRQGGYLTPTRKYLWEDSILSLI